MTIARRHLSFIILFVASAVAVNARADRVVRWTLDDSGAGIQNLGTDGATSNLVAATPSASIGGGPTYTASGGKLDGYASFDGNQALITTTSGNAGDDLVTYPFTFSAWIRPLFPISQGNRGAAVAMSNTSASNIYFTLGVEATFNASVPADSNDVQAVRRNTAFVSTEGVGTAATAYDGSWHHVAVVNASSTSSHIYYDGVDVGSNATAVSFSSTINSLSLGGFLRSTTAWTDKYRGDIDEVQMYNDALVGSQILYLFNNPAGPAPPIAACDVDLVNGCTIADLQIIANHFFTNTTNRTDGDLNSDGIVNFADYRIWKDTSGSGATLEDVMGSVPEPATIVLVLLVLPGLCLCSARPHARR